MVKKQIADTTETTYNLVPEEEIGKAGTTVREGVISSLKGINEIEAEIVNVVQWAGFLRCCLPHGKMGGDN